MISTPKGIGLSYFAVLIALIALSCASSPGIYLQYGNSFSEGDLAKILAENPLGPDENIKLTTLGKGEGVSHHVVQVRNREMPHIHKDRDLTIVVLKGAGYLILDGRPIDLVAGDIVFIPRAIPHYFVNTFREPTSGLAVFSPPFDGKDTIPIGKP